MDIKGKWLRLITRVRSGHNSTALQASPAGTGHEPELHALLDYKDELRGYSEELDDTKVVGATRIVKIVCLLIIVLLAWSYFATVAEVSTGMGKVVPSSREQVIQTLEGGIVTGLNVAAGDIVEPHQILAQLDLTKTASMVEESASRYRATLARIARLEAEVNDTPLVFPEELQNYPELIVTENRLYSTRRQALQESLRGIELSLELVEEELTLTRSLAEIGAASDVEVLRLRRQVSELKLQKNDTLSEYMITARQELASASEEARALSAVVRGRTDSLSRLTLRSPVRGIVKEIEVTTLGGVIPPNGRLMNIVPLDDKLLIEARISPRDIAFIHPGQEAKVKITAYDYNVFGDLDGVVSLISPDTTQDEANPEVFYYRVFIRTDTDALVDEAGTRFPIVPGMIATVDIRTGEKTIFDYLMKPVSNAKEALRER